MQNHFKLSVALIYIMSMFLLQQTNAQQNIVYPKIAAYVSILHPIVTINNQHVSTNFNNYYQVFFPFGINIWKSAKTGFSVELAPGIRAEQGKSKMNNLLIHPGILVALGKGFVFAGRAAFETSGRYGFTPVFSKIIKKNKGSALYIATPLPVRFGNDLPASFTVGFQVGITF